VEKQIARILRKNQILKPPVPVESIAQSEGIQVVEAPTGPNISGALVRAKDGAVSIAVNSAHHINRRRFTVAHELGHFYLKHPGTDLHVDGDFTINLRDQTSSEATDENEIDANAFAAGLLMPREFLMKDLLEVVPLDEEKVLRLAKKYEVSEQAMTIRLVNLGFLSPA
jgi:Zn-dependent peptidase ImmA (M78 family)